MSDMFDEANMRQALGCYVPDGETLLAGIHAVSKETNIRAVFGKCIRTESSLLPDEKGGVVAVNRKKYGVYDLYIGVTQSSLVLAECDQNSYLYQFEDNPADIDEASVRPLTKGLFFHDIGTCFPLADIRDRAFKKGVMGSIKCRLTMKDGSFFKLLLPKRGGIGGGMPHHAEYRDRILARLGATDL